MLVQVRPALASRVADPVPGVDVVPIPTDGPLPAGGGRYREYVEAAVEPGRVRYIPRGGIETAVNVGGRRYREILIELT